MMVFGPESVTPGVYASSATFVSCKTAVTEVLQDVLAFGEGLISGLLLVDSAADADSSLPSGGARSFSSTATLGP